MTSSPKVVFNCKFRYAINHYKRHTPINSDYEKKQVIGMFNYYKNEKKRAINMFDYYMGYITPHNSVNLVLENGKFASQEELEKRKKEYTTYIENSNIWLGVISFNNDYVDNNISLKDLENMIVTKVIPKFLKKIGFDDINKMSYQVALHTNTDNYHFHFSFIEKEPNYIDKKGNLNYRKIGKIGKSCIEFLKNEIVLQIEKEKYFTPKVISINKDIDELKKYFKPTEKNYILKNIDDLVLEENILKLGQLLYDYKNGSNSKIKFNSINNKEIKTLTKNIKNYLFKNKKSELYNHQEIFKSDLDSLNEYLYSLNNENNINSRKKTNKIVKDKAEYIDNYVYNAIVNRANFIYGRMKDSKKYIKDEDLIQEAVLKVYKKNVKQNKFTIIKNYLSNKIPSAKYPNRYNIEQAIKKLNNEIDEAKTEFSKLFQSNDYYK